MFRDTFQRILVLVQRSSGIRCHHGALLCEGVEDCQRCFEAALEIFRLTPAVLGVWIATEERRAANTG